MTTVAILTHWSPQVSKEACKVTSYELYCTCDVCLLQVFISKTVNCHNILYFDENNLAFIHKLRVVRPTDMVTLTVHNCGEDSGL